MSTESVKFRSAVGGYNREDVNSYIISTQQSYKERETKLESKLADSQLEIDSAKAKINELEKKLAESAEMPKNGVGDESVASEIKEEYEAKIAQLEAKVNELQAELSERSEQTDVDVNAEDDTDVAARVGSIMITANSVAEQLKQNARAEADKIVSGAWDEAETIKLNISKKATAAIESVSSELRSALDSLIADTLNTVDDIKTETEDLAYRVAAKKAEIDSKLNMFASGYTEKIKMQINAISLDDRE